MKKTFAGAALMPCLLLSLSGCSAIGEKMAGISVIYAATTLISLLLLIGYCCLVHEKEFWFLLLFSSVFVVNVGYLAMSVSGSLEEALLANRIAYLGSVFLPVSMLMIILGACRLKYKMWLPVFLLGIGVVVFLVAASPGYLDIYYKRVSLQFIGGVAVLVKEYGPWHKLYLIYLLSYFATMIAVIIHASAKKRISSKMHVVILLVAVFVNIGVWLLEQMVKVDFEFLSVSYIISELFLISLYLMMQECGLLTSTAKVPEAPPVEPNPFPVEEESVQEAPVTPEPEEIVPSPTDEYLALCQQFEEQIKSLTPTERLIYDLYLEGKTTREIMKALNIKENTLKYHNKNIYGKLGVRSRKQLCEIARALEQREK